MTISIIIQVFNTEEYLPICLDSILSQNFMDFEILLVDDGSKDGSGALCDAYAAKDSRVRVLHKENGGVSSARNLALAQAQGDWICFVDSDDRLVQDGLKVLAEGISDQVDLVMADYIEATLPLEGYVPMPNEMRVVSRNEAMVSMFSRPDWKFEGYVFAKLFRRTLVLQEHIEFDPAIASKEDTLFVVHFLCVSGRPVSVSGNPVYYYIQRPSSVMNSLQGSYNPKYLSSFEAIVQMNRLVESAFSYDRKLLYISRDEVMNRIYRVKSHMLKHDVLNKEIVSQLTKRAYREVGIAHFSVYQFRRYRRRAVRIINRLFKTHFHL